MGRKSISDLKSVDKLTEDAVEEFKSVSEMKWELARDAYELQDKETKAVIDRIVATLRTYANGYIAVQLNPPTGETIPVKIENDYLDMNLLWLAVEVVKDLAFIGVQVASFEFPPSLCAQCGADIIPEKRSGRKAGRG
jgi:hypothetical protein